MKRHYVFSIRPLPRLMLHLVANALRSIVCTQRMEPPQSIHNREWTRSLSLTFVGGFVGSFVGPKLVQNLSSGAIHRLEYSSPSAASIVSGRAFLASPSTEAPAFTADAFRCTPKMIPDGILGFPTLGQGN